MPTHANLRMHKSRFTIGALSDRTEEKRYWKGKSPRERLAALETNRQVVYGTHAASARLQRVFTIIKQKKS